MCFFFCFFFCACAFISVCVCVCACRLSPASSTYIPLPNEQKHRIWELPIQWDINMFAQVCVSPMYAIHSYTACCLCDTMWMHLYMCMCVSVCVCPPTLGCLLWRSSLLANNCIWRERETSHSSVWHFSLKAGQREANTYTHTHTHTHTHHIHPN